MFFMPGHYDIIYAKDVVDTFGTKLTAFVIYDYDAYPFAARVRMRDASCVVLHAGFPEGRN